MHAFSNRLRDAFAHWKTGMLSFRLRRTGDSMIEQNRVLDQLLEGFSKSDFGRAHKLSPGLSYLQFRERVPPQSDSSLAPLISQMAEGVPDVLWPGTCKCFATLQTLPGEAQRLLPITNDLAWHFRKTWRRALLHLAVRGAPVSILRASQLWLGTAPKLLVFGEANLGCGMGELPDILAACLLEDFAISCHPDLQITSLRPVANASSAASAEPSLIVIREPRQLASLLVAEGQAFLAQTKPSVILIGAYSNSPKSTYSDSASKDLMLHEVFACEAGIIAVQDGEPELGLRLITYSRLFPEFIAIADQIAAFYRLLSTGKPIRHDLEQELGTELQEFRPLAN